MNHPIPFPGIQKKRRLPGRAGRLLATLALLLALGGGACISPQPTQYESTETNLDIPRAPAGTERVKVALITFRNQTGREFLVAPATSQLTSIMFQSGYFDVLEPTLVESVIRNQSEVTPENLQKLQERFGAQYFLTGTLTNFEIKRQSSGFCLFFGLLGSQRTEEYIVETGIDYRLVRVPDGKLLDANVVENRRVDTSKSAGILFSGGGYETSVLQASGGKLLRHAMADLTEKLVANLPQN